MRAHAISLHRLIKFTFARMAKIANQETYMRHVLGEIDFVVKSDIVGMLCSRWNVTDLLKMPICCRPLV